MTSTILLVINGTDFGGTESALFETACRLRLRDHNVYVLSLKPIGRMGRQLGSAGVPVESLDMPESIRPAVFLAGCWRLAKYLRQRRPNVVHSFLPRANVMCRLALKLARLRTPHVSSERSTDLKRRGTVSLLNRYTARWTSRVLAVSPEVRNMLVQRDGIPEQRISVLENGIDLERVDALPPNDVGAELGLEPCHVRLCSAGRLVPDKGHVYLIRAMSQMRTRNQVQLLLVGEGAEEAPLRAEAAAHGLSEQVHFLGYRADLVQILKAVDVFVLPSLEEGIPVVVLEAMACARPVVATDVGGVRTLVTPGQTGMLVPPAEIWKLEGRGAKRSGANDRDTAADGITLLAEALDRMVTSPSVIVEMGRRARRRVEAKFTLDRIVTRLERVYEEVAAEQRPRAYLDHWLTRKPANTDVPNPLS